MGVICCQELRENKKNKDKLIFDKMSEEEKKNYLESLFKSQYAAKTYFYDNELKEKEAEAQKCCGKIFDAQKLLNEGNHKKINFEDLPKKMSPEFITGYTPEKRKEKINEIIKELEKEKYETKKIMDNRILQGKKFFHNIFELLPLFLLIHCRKNKFLQHNMIQIMILNNFFFLLHSFYQILIYPYFFCFL